jgi:hypothetical protein
MNKVIGKQIGGSEMPEMGQCWKHSGYGTVYRRITPELAETRGLGVGPIRKIREGVAWASERVSDKLVGVGAVWTDTEQRDIVLLETVFEVASKKSVVITLNEDYSATISSDGVKVGCQTFSFEKVREIMAEIDNWEKP